MAFPERVAHPHITRREGIADGKPVIVGTRIKVSQLAIETERLGWTPDEIVQAHPHLTLAQIHDALSYYYDHQAAIDAEIAADEKYVAELRASYSSKLDQSDADQNLHG